MIDKKYVLESSLKAARMSRLVAKMIDLFIVFILTQLFFPIGILLGAAYMCVADSLQRGESVGKKFMGFAVISLKDGKPCSLKQSVIRNLPITIPLIFFIIPLWGWFFSILIGIPLIFLEVYLLYRLDSGNRLGDVMADTTVIAGDYKKEGTKSAKDSSWFEDEDSSLATRS